MSLFHVLRDSHHLLRRPVVPVFRPECDVVAMIGDMVICVSEKGTKKRRCKDASARVGKSADER